MLALATPDVSDRATTSADFARQLRAPRSVAYHAAALGASVGLSFASQSLVGLALYAATVSSVTAVWFRPIASWALTRDDADVLVGVAAAVVGATGAWAAGVLEPRGLARHPQSRWVPVHFAACLVSFGVAGHVVYDDWAGVEAWRWAASACSLVSVCASVWLVAG